jgi:hypothetical protein
MRYEGPGIKSPKWFAPTTVRGVWGLAMKLAMNIAMNIADAGVAPRAETR